MLTWRSSSVSLLCLSFPVIFAPGFGLPPVTLLPLGLNRLPSCCHNENPSPSRSPAGIPSAPPTTPPPTTLEYTLDFYRLAAQTTHSLSISKLSMLKTHPNSCLLCLLFLLIASLPPHSIWKPQKSSSIISSPSPGTTIQLFVISFQF